MTARKNTQPRTNTRKTKHVETPQEQTIPDETPVVETTAIETSEPSTTPAAAPSPVGKLSALDAAARVLAETREAMNTMELIGAMAAKGYWTSPGGKTPASTLYAAILRELNVKGEKARFRKAARGRFVLADHPG